MTTAITLVESQLIAAAKQGEKAFAQTVLNAIIQGVGSELNANTMQQLNAAQITLWGFHILHQEVMEGGFVQLIHNGYGPFFFDNPFAKAMRLWGLKDLSKLLYNVRELYILHQEPLCAEGSDEDFMALYEQYPAFDDLDEEFITNEETYVARLAHYVDEHLDNFVQILP